MIHSKEDRKELIEQAGELGYAAFGPVLLSFSSWLARQAAELRLQHLYFLSREGYFLLDLYKKFLSLGLTPDPNIPATYLSMSRRAAYGAAEKSRASLKAMIMAGPYEGNLYDLLEGRIGLSPEFCQKISLPNPKIEVLKESEKILDILTPSLPALNEQAKMERETLAQYLRQEGLYDVETAALVDLGYSGSIQRWLYSITGKKMAGFYFATTTVVDDFETEENKIYSCFAKGCSVFRSPPVYRYALTLESWLTAPTGQVLHFVREDGRAVPQHAPTGKMQELFKVVTAVAHGVERYFDDFAYLAKFDPDWEKDLNARAQDVLAATVESHVFSSVLDFLSVEDAFCGHGEISISERITDLMSDMRLSEMLVDTEHRQD